MYDVMDIVKYFMNKDYFTNKQIQKMLYYAYGWYLVRKNEVFSSSNIKLFKEEIEAWVHGPVVPIAYKKILNSNYRELKQGYNNSVIDINDQLFLDKIIKIYGKHTGYELEKMTHNELPWQKARGDLPDDEISQNKIEDKDIFEFFHAYIK